MYHHHNLYQWYLWNFAYRWRIWKSFGGSLQYGVNKDRQRGRGNGRNSRDSHVGRKQSNLDKFRMGDDYYDDSGDEDGTTGDDGHGDGRKYRRNRNRNRYKNKNKKGGRHGRYASINTIEGSVSHKHSAHNGTLKSKSCKKNGKTKVQFMYHHYHHKH